MILPHFVPVIKGCSRTGSGLVAAVRRLQRTRLGGWPRTSKSRVGLGLTVLMLAESGPNSNIVEGICLEKPPFLRRFSLHNEGMSDRERAISMQKG